jgi:hypothetical protein
LSVTFSINNRSMLPLLHLRAWMAPEARKVGCENHQLGTLDLDHDVCVGGFCFLVRLVYRGERTESRVPACFQGTRYQAIVKIALEEAALR